MCDEINEAGHVLEMMGAHGVPVEAISEASPDDSWFEFDGGQWTVEEIDGCVYTFCVGAADQPMRGE